MKESFFQKWREYFEWNAAEPDTFPWQARESMSEQEKHLFGASISAFIRGNEFAGDALAIHAPVFAERMGFKIPPDILSLFLAESRNDSALLKRFLDKLGGDHDGIGRRVNVFHRLRIRAGIGTSLSSLVNAKLAGLIYYRALREATGSRLLKALCNKLLEDEKSQAEFESALILFAQCRAGTIRRWAWLSAQRLLFAFTLIILFWEHRTVMKKGGYSFPKFFLACRAESHRYFPRVLSNMGGLGPVEQERPRPGAEMAAGGPAA